MASLLNKLAYLTADLPGVGGVIKQRHADFLVEEQPVGDLVGEGEHLYLYIEKVGTTTQDAAHRIAKAFRIGKRELGWAGLKDKHAVTRQQVSVRLPVKPTEEELAYAIKYIERRRGVKVLWHAWHDRKLRRGHHAGNRFVLRVREVDPTCVIAAKKVVDELAAKGLPNYIGEQRFGFRQNSHEHGRLLLEGDDEALLASMLGEGCEQDSPAMKKGREAYRAGDYLAAMNAWPKPLRHDRQALDALRQGRTPAEAVRKIDAAQRAFLLTALQSHGFNLVLDARVRDGTWGTLLPGDLAMKAPGRALFPVDEATAALENGEGGRMRTMALSATGPMVGPGMPEPTGAVAETEAAALQAMGVTREQMDAGRDGVTAEGARRPLRVPLKDPDLSSGVDEHGAFLRLAFELPRGSYATVALREVMKVDLHEASGPGAGKAADAGMSKSE